MRPGSVDQTAALCQAAGEGFCNASKFTLRDLKARAKQQQLKADFEAYLDGFSPNVQEILDKFKFRNQIPTLVEADILGSLIEKFLDAGINLSPKPVLDGERRGQAAGARQSRHGHHLRGTDPPLQRGEQRRGWRALYSARRGEAHGGPDLAADRRSNRVGHLSRVRRRLWHRRHVDGCGRTAEAVGAATMARRFRFTSTGRKSIPKPTPSPRRTSY